MWPISSKVKFLSAWKSFIALAYTRPLRFLKDVFSKKTFQKVVDQLYNPNQTDELKAFSAAFGIFMGIIPIWGLQTLVAIFFAMIFKLNKALVVIFSQVSFPPLFPLIVFLSYKTGQYWMGGKGATISSGAKTSLASINQHFWQYLYGSVTLAVVAAIVTGLLTFISLKLLKAFRQNKLAAVLKKA